LLTIITPRYDVERLGVKMAGTPRHADVLVVTGSVTLQSRDRLLRIYNQIPDPKFVLALGSCALSGGVFHDCYCCIQGGVDKVIPVDVYVPGCPPRPEAVIYGLVKLLDVIKNGKTNPAENKPTLIPSKSELIDLERPAESA
jgi:Ni,Fe-hydrogenase III small subunit